MALENKTIKETFKQSAEKPVKSMKGLSDGEVQKQMGNYAAVAKTTVDKSKMNELKDKYRQESSRMMNSSGARLRHFDEGKKAGLHSNMTREQFIQNEKSMDQKFRDTKLNNAKQYYRNNYSLTKEFDEKSKER